jgi:hypothetical protein
LIAIVLGIPDNHSPDGRPNIWIHLWGHVSTIYKISNLHNAAHRIIANVYQNPERRVMFNFAMNQFPKPILRLNLILELITHCITSALEL